jgi:hypothetical protein
MRTVASGTALMLFFAVPAFFGDAASSFLPFAPRQAMAQQADAVTEVARQRFEDGVKAYDAGRFEDARAAFLHAYALKRHPAVLLNLGQSEIKSGHVEEGGTHLLQYLRESPNATADQKASAEKGIADAKKRTGFVIINVDAQGSEVSIDGTLVGKSPLIDPVFVKPGKHTVVATYQGKTATTPIDAKVGVATAANLTLGTSGSGAAAAPPPAAPAGAGPAQPIGAAPTQPPPSAAFPPPGEPVMQPPAASGDAHAGMQPDQATGGREPFFDWYKRKPLAWVGTALTAVGLGLGIGFSIAASAASGAANDHSQQIKDYARNHPQPGIDPDNPRPCGSPDTGGSDAAGYEDACDALRKDLTDYDTDVAVAVTGWVLFGVGAIGTVTYAMVDWFPKKNAKTGFIAPHSIAIAPVITPSQRGIGVVGRF